MLFTRGTCLCPSVGKGLHLATWNLKQDVALNEQAIFVQCKLLRMNPNGLVTKRILVFNDVHKVQQVLVDTC